MTDLTKQLLPGLTKYRPDWMEWDDQFIYPAYQGQSILNIPATICSWFGVPGLHGNPLIKDIQSVCDDDIQHIVLILMDALSLQRFKRWLLENKVPVWNKLLKSGLLAPLTSICPSTTSAAMTTLWTGCSPAEHGVAGYELWLKKYGIVTNMISQSPMSYHGSRNSLENAGFRPEEALNLPTLGAHLSDHGISPYSFQHYSIAYSGLSQTFMKKVNLNSFGSAAELWTDLRQLLESRKEDRLYTWVYWGTFDGLSHRFGPEDVRPELEFINFSDAFEKNFLGQGTDSLARNTLLLLTADHGQIYTAKNPLYDLQHHPEFLECLHIKPTGENRLAYLHVRPGKIETVRSYIGETWPEQFITLESRAALEHGLLGPGEENSEIRSRVGDLIVIPRKDNYLWWSNEENPLLGRHGGLRHEEMLVPLLACML
jgi:predicted AlkP superfamily pyrophosphatase or phosphodiesterase